MKRRPELPKGPYLIVGLARSGIAAGLALRERGERVIAVDVGRPTDAEQLTEAGVELYLGEEGVDLLAQVSAIVKSPGVPAEAPVIRAAREQGLPVLGELELGWRLLDNEFIAVTGTNGKTTTVELIAHIHRAAHLPVAVAGNVGTALSGLAGKLDEAVAVVCECSSFQLEDTVAFAPEAAVLLNLTPDHLDRHGTLEAYTLAKLEIFRRQSKADIAVLPAKGIGLAGRSHRGAARLVRFGAAPGSELAERDGQLYWEDRPLMPVEALGLRGAHNLENAMAAAAVCLARGVDRAAVRAGLESFEGVPHRLEEVAEVAGVLYVNDSKATNLASALVALEALGNVGPIHLIMGGEAKGQEFAELGPAVQRRAVAVYLIGRDAPVIAAALSAAGVSVEVGEYGELERAVAAAGAAAKPGEVVLLAPACSSFDQFANFEDRGERFKGFVRGRLPSSHVEVSGDAGSLRRARSSPESP